MICVACEIPKFTLEIVPLTDYVEQMLLQALKSVGVEVTDAVVLLDRDQGGAARLSSQGIKLHRWQIVFIYLKNSNMIYLVICDWCNKGHCMSYSVSGMVHIKKTLLQIRKSSPFSGGSGFPFSLSEWSFTACLHYITINKMC